MFKLMRKMRVLRFVASAVLGLALMIGVFTLATPTMAQTYITFDAQAQPSITRPLGINNAGLIVGITAGAAFPNTRGFVGNPDGNITLFAVANTTNASTAPSSINDNGQIAGHCGDCGGSQGVTFHGFLRNVDGTFVVFDPSDSTNTFPTEINNSGQIVGFINTSQANKQRGFMRDADGVITEFDAPSPCTSTAATRINNADTVAGICIDQVSNQSYGFVRDAQGNFTLFNPPGAFNINVVSINAPGQIAGTFFDAANVQHCYVRNPDGTFTIFEVPGSGDVRSFNDSGVITGEFADTSQGNKVRGYIRDRNGNLTFFDVPQASRTEPASLNDSAVITGFFVDSNHPNGSTFVRIPPES